MSVNASFFNTYFVAERPLCRVGVFSCKKRGNLNPFRGLSKKNAFFLIFFEKKLKNICKVLQICVTLQYRNKQHQN